MALIPDKQIDIPEQGDQIDPYELLRDIVDSAQGPRAADSNFKGKVVSRRWFLGGGAVAGAVALGSNPLFQGLANWAESANGAATESQIPMEKINDVVAQNFSTLGLEMQTITNQKGEEKAMLFPRNKKVIDILTNADDSAGPEKQLDVIMDVADAVAEEVKNEHGLELEDNALMDIVGSIVAAWGITNGFVKGGITTGDYARISAFTGVAYLVGGEQRRTHLRHNLEETVLAVRDIGTITEVSDFVIAQKKGLISEFMKEQSVTPGVSADELEDFLEKVRLEKPELLPDIENKLLQFEHENVGALIQSLREGGETDTAAVLDAVSSIEFEHMSRTDALKTIVILANTLGPLLTTLVSTSVLSPLCRAIASDGNGGFDKDVMSILQSYVPNNFGLTGLGFIPGYYDTLGKITKGIPVLESAFVGADFGPRLAVMQKSSGHGTEVLSILDGVNAFTQVGMMGGFAAEMSVAIARLERAAGNDEVSTGKVLMDVLNLKNYPATLSALKQEYSLAPNIKDALFGRVQRAMKVVYNSFDSSTRHLKHAHMPEVIDTQDQKLGEIAVGMEAVFNAADAHKPEAPKKGIRARVAESGDIFSHLTNVHNWESAIGPELTDIMKTLPFQSLCVPYVEGVAKMAVGSIETVLPQDMSPFMRNQVIDAATYSAFGMMSTSFDNFAANKAALTVALDRVKKMYNEGTLENVGKRITAVVKKMYDASVIFGGMLPLGNMPNFKMFPMNLYTLKDAIKRLPRRMIPAAIAFFVDASTEFFGLYPEMDPNWFFKDDIEMAH